MGLSNLNWAEARVPGKTINKLIKIPNFQLFIDASFQKYFKNM
jgi:hypothetical protein